MFFVFCILFFKIVIIRARLYPLRGVAKHGRTITDEQKVDGDGENQQISRRGAGDVAGGVDQVELTSTRDVDVTAWLVRSRVQAEVQQVRAGVLGSVDVGTAKRPREVVTEELRVVLLEDVDTVRLELQGVDSLRRVREGQLLAGHLRGERLVLGADSVERNTIVSHDGANGLSSGNQGLVREQRQAIPIAVAVGVVGGIDVVRRAQTHEHVLNGPLQL